ncbi:50S ribosomal protein L18 [Candidatus Wolfebacteria bacterium RBG_13_41_7]|uniref:Large ribosomal subunit protein uL18 n=1 Tax=Candidatus Wolfebacteria bacterium RBG_13_41_7 TaxID=1802554 RepID=A0A1F8DL60_9BACT|nr:MAG: 50S ribosomal protein L18 [Candidatus Wolfebacteria bacterium RBG_13_41_7]
MKKGKALNEIKERRKKRTRARLSGSSERPRFSVFRSNNYVYVQIIDDENGKTLVSASTMELKKQKKAAGKELAEKLGELIAKKAVEKGVKKVVFDRGSYSYHGRVQAVAEAARKGGLEF